jgi:hypothetical protein
VVIDHLIVDQDSVLTFVEVKRASDTRSRREGRGAESMPPGEALRALKRQISDVIYKHLKADAARAATHVTQGPGGQPGNDSVASAAGSHPECQIFGQATPGPASTLRSRLQKPPYAPEKRPSEPRDAKRHRSVRIPRFLRSSTQACITGCFVPSLG